MTETRMEDEEIERVKTRVVVDAKDELEDWAKRTGEDGLEPATGEADLFIYPGYRFALVEGLLTNFHLPQSTLLMLVCGFAGREAVLEAYEHAVREKYRFYSYGDCMFIE